MQGLPKLPGFTFRDVTKQRFHLHHQFDTINGFSFPLNKRSEVGGGPCDADALALLKTEELCGYDSTLTYGRLKKPPVVPFVPTYVTYAMKCLAFKGFMKQGVFESAAEHFRVRFFQITYFLEDDTLMIYEPPVKNSGFPMGKMVSRSQIPKDNMGNFLNWRDINVGLDITIHGKVFHIYDCDPYTKEYLRSQGIEVGEKEEPPNDPYTFIRHMKETASRERVTPLVDDKLRRFLEFDGKVLTFSAVWDDRDTELGECREFIISYFLCDDTITVKENYPKNSGRDPVPMLIKKMRIPRNWDDYPVTWPSIYMERGDPEVTEYVQPKHFMVGETIFLVGRKFFIYDCDNFSRNYFKNFLNIKQKPRLDILPKAPPPQEVYIPPHIMVGTPEDTVQSVFSIVPKAPKTDAVKYLLYGTDPPLRWEADMDLVHPEDTIRKFIIMYYIRDSKIKIVEKPIDNSGFDSSIGTTFLKVMTLAKPGQPRENPELYSPADFYIGAFIEIFGKRFRITGGDLRVYRYMCENRHKFTPEQINNMRNYQILAGNMTEDLSDQMLLDAEAEKQAYLAKLVEEKPLPPTDIEICYAEMSGKPKDEVKKVLDPTECPDNFEDYVKLMDRINNPVDNAAAERAAALEKARQFDTVCHEPPPRYGINLNKDKCAYDIIPNREPPREMRYIEKKKEVVVCPPVPENSKEYDTSHICPTPPPKPEPPCSPCDYDRNERPSDILDMAWPKQFQSSQPSRIETKDLKDFECTSSKPVGVCSCKGEK